MRALTIPRLETSTWQIRNKSDPAVLALADRHYSRQTPGSNQAGPPGRKKFFVTPCERALWISHWPDDDKTLDGLAAWRCNMFRNEGAGLSSLLILDAMELTRERWGGGGLLPPDGWVTFVDTSKVDSVNPGYCFKQAGWWLDRTYSHRDLIRLRASV